MTDLAPIILFAFNRPVHTKKTLEALSNNYLAYKSHLIVFCDGPRDIYDREGVEKVKEIINDFRKKNIFKSFTVKESSFNKGLARSIISGVTEVLNSYEKVIVLEDDLVSSKDYLTFMNASLSFYQHNSNIGCVTGYNPIKGKRNDYKYDIYFLTRSSSKGWATYKNVWEKIDWNALEYKYFRKSYIDRLKFNANGFDRSKRLDRQMTANVNSWSILFGFNLFYSNKFTVYPKDSKIIDCGMDGSGIHTNSKVNKFNSELVESKYPLKLPQKIFIDFKFMANTRKLFGYSVREFLSDFISYLKHYR